MKYTEFENIVERNKKYTEKDIWYGKRDTGYWCATDGKYVQKQKDARKHSMTERNKEVLFMGPYTRYVHYVEDGDIKLIGFLDTNCLGWGWTVEGGDTVPCEELMTLDGIVCIYKDTALLTTTNDKYRFNPEEKDIDFPDEYYCFRRSYDWKRVNTKSVKTTKGVLATDFLKEVFHNFITTAWDLLEIEDTRKRNITPYSIIHTIARGYSLGDDYIQFTEMEPLPNADTGAYIDFENNNAFFRLYIDGKEVARLGLANDYYYLPYLGGVWGRTDGAKDRYAEAMGRVFVADKERFDKSPLKYSVLDLSKNVSYVKAEIRANRNTPYEQLMKTKYADTLKDYFSKGSYNIESEMQRLFAIDRFTEPAKNLYQKVKLNKYQFEYVMDALKNGGDVPRVLSTVRAFLIRVDTDILSITNNDFKELYDFLNTLHEKRGRYIRSYVETVITYLGYKDMVGVARMFNTLYTDLKSKYRGDFILEGRPLPIKLWGSCVDHYFDYLNIRTQLLNTSFIRKKDAPVDIYTKTKDEVVFQTMHDKVSHWKNIESDLHRPQVTQKWKEQMENWKKYTYNSEKFDLCVVAPEEPNDLVVEGKKLHHCVAGYVDRVSEGKTNVVFIRRKEAKDEPFYTVEIQKDRIMQIHGLQNCNPTPEVLAFVVRWAHVKKLKLGDYKQLRG